MTPDRVELVARAFYATEYSGHWDDAPENLQKQFRSLARMAIALMHRQNSDCQPSPTRAKHSDVAHGEDAVQLLS